MKKENTLPQKLPHPSSHIPDEKLLNALVSYFLKENDKLGLDIKVSRISAICKTLLNGNEDNPNSFTKWRISENTVFDEYKKSGTEIIDYLHLVSIEMKKQLGQYSTPSNIVKYILKSVNYNSSKHILNKKLIDPACGSGAFLVEVVRIYLNAFKKANVPLHKWYPMVNVAITGIDIDPKACFFVRLNLSMLLATSILEFVVKNGIEKIGPLPIYCADTLGSMALELRGEKLLYAGLNIQLKKQFDFVVGNPPYFKIRGMSKDLRNAFAESIYGHPNAYGVFIHAGIEMLRTKGKLGFIIPKSMVSGLYFKDLRNFIDKNMSLKGITCISERKKVFDNVLHGTMIISLERDKKCLEEVNISNVQSINDIEKHRNRITVKKENIIQQLNGTTVWFVADSEKAYKIINSIIKDHHLLSGSEINLRAKTGQIVWNRVKPLLTGTSRPDTLPLIWATDIGKFSFSFNKTGPSRPAFLEIMQKTLNLVVKGPGILVQRITADEQPSRIVACIPESFCKSETEGYFVENHLNIILPNIKKPNIDLYFILGVLNSNIVDFFFRAMNGNTQVSATELNLLPIPIGKHESGIAGTARKIQKAKDGKKRCKLINELNTKVADAYGLNDSELEYIRKQLSYRFN